MVKKSDLGERISQLSAAVVGDVCLDAYYFLSENLGPISIETGKATRAVERHTFDGGGAANVALNLKSLGVGTVDLYGVVGDDAFALVLASVLGKGGVSNCTVTQRANWATNVYNKFYCGGVEEPRVDLGNFNLPHPEAINELLTRFQSRLSGYDFVILNQQVVGSYQTEVFQHQINALMETTRGRTQWYCDCRDLNEVYFSTVHKLNREEGLRIYLAHHKEGSGTSLSDSQLVLWLSAHWNDTVVLTNGEDGALVAEGKEHFEVPGVHIIHQVDTVGAGDAFLAAFASAHRVGVGPQMAANLGNVAASVAVQKLFQTGHPTWEEVQTGLISTDYRYNPVLAANPLLATYLPGTDIEGIAKVSSPTPNIAIFDHDGTISTLRIGWETVMESMMIGAVFGEDSASATKHLSTVRAAVTGLIARTTGVQTLLQMQALVKLVEDFGFVGADQILSAQEYKEQFNTKLLKLIHTRTARVKDGSLSVGEVTIKGAVEFLQRLADGGVTLYLASGTDEQDVVAEATLLGYAHLFQGRIYGSVGNLDKDPKRLVFEQIFGELSRSRGGSVACVVFGDGPVELREGKKFGATAVGLVSDERQRYGLNPAKRNRLVLAGADLLIPDFSWGEKLLQHLGWKL